MRAQLRSPVRTATLATAITLLATGALLAQQPTPTAPGAAQPAAAGHTQEAPWEYTLGPGDVVSVRVVGVSQQGGIRVSNSGKIHVPHLGVMRVHGLTTTQLEGEIAKRLREQGLVNDPWVQVGIEKRLSKPVYVLGEVMIPGQFPMRDELRVLDLVSLAGGFNEFAIPVAYLYRRKPVPHEGLKPGDPPEAQEWSETVIPVDFEKIASGEDPEGNFRIEGGDVLYVPEREKLYFYVVGDVVKAGAFEFPQRGANPKGSALSRSPLRVTEAIAKAGGPMRTAKTGSGVVVRFAPDGSRKEFPVDLVKVLKGEQPDIFIEPNDIVYVPGSTAKSFAYSVLRVVPGVLIGSLVF